MKFWKLCTLALAFITAPAQAINEDELLMPEKAFAFDARIEKPGVIHFGWDVAEGYYLYRDRISFSTQSAGITLGRADLPAGKIKDDEFFGRVETYRKRIEGTLSYSLDAGTQGPLELKVKSQGCADLGVCYPPYTQIVTLDIPQNELQTPANNLLTSSQNSGGLLSMAEPWELTPEGDFLPPDQAFKSETLAMDADTILVRFTIARGYYLYHDKFSFTFNDPGIQVIEVSYPKGKDKVDPHFGSVEIYQDVVEIPLEIKRLEANPAEAELTIGFQGCADEAICYPPAKARHTIQLPEAAGQETGEKTEMPTVTSANDTVTREAAPISEQDAIAEALKGDGWLTVLSFFGIGLLLSFTPCVFPMIPILSGIIAGHGSDMDARKGFFLSLSYVLAMAVTYTIAGVIAGLFGQNLQAAFQNPWILGTFSGVFVLLALSMFGFYELQLPTALQSRLSEISNRQEGGTWIGAAIMGFLSALIVGPCVAPPLAGALIYIGQTQDPWLGGAALFSLSMGMGAPLVAIGTGAGKYLPRAGTWMESVKAVFGVLLLALALWMLERILPAEVIMMLLGILCLTSSVYMGTFENLPHPASGWKKLWKGLGAVLALIGILQIIGATSGNDDWMQPLKSSNITYPVAANGQAASGKLEFRKITSLADLNAKIDKAAAEGKSVMLDFYADWCIECKRMEKNTFSNPGVMSALSSTVLLKADVTDNNDQDQELLQSFGLIGPPAILFFNARGEELRPHRLVGYKGPVEFEQHINAALQP